MTTERDYRYIVDDVYAVDSHKVKVPLKEGAVVAQGKFKIITAPVDNTSNGMQAMAVAPVDKKGNVDYSHVVIAYAGTNSSDMKDIETDLQSLGLGRDKLQLCSGLNSAKVVDSQFTTALDFAKEVEKEVKKKNPAAKITTAGHSLGQSLAMYVALKQGYANVQ